MKNPPDGLSSHGLTCFSWGTAEQVPRSPSQRQCWRLGRVRTHLQMAWKQQRRVEEPLALEVCRKKADSFAMSTRTRPSNLIPAGGEGQQHTDCESRAEWEPLTESRGPQCVQRLDIGLRWPLQVDRKAAADSTVAGLPLLQGGTTCPATATCRAIHWCAVLLSTPTKKRIGNLAFLLVVLPGNPDLQPVGSLIPVSVPSCVV